MANSRNRLHYLLQTTPGEGSVRNGVHARREALRDLALALATQFPDSQELTAVGRRLEDLLRHDSAGVF